MSSLIGSLTTIFTPASECASRVNGFIYTEKNGETHKYHSLGLTLTPACYPTGFVEGQAYYSPGVCPMNWQVACQENVRAGTATETKAMCCPNGYVCQSAAESSSWSTLSCVGSSPTANIYVSESDGVKIYPLTGNIAVHAMPINIRWRADDFAITSAASSTTTSVSNTAAPASTLSTGTSPTSTPPPSSSSPGSSLSTVTPSAGLSTGAKAGIGAGVGIGVLLLFAFLALFFLIRRRRRRSQAEGSGGNRHEKPQAELGDTGRMELNSPVRTELNTPHSSVNPRSAFGWHSNDPVPHYPGPQELQDQRRFYELSAGKEKYGDGTGGHGNTVRHELGVGREEEKMRARGRHQME